MNEQILRPASVAAGAVLIGGVVVLIVPEHAVSVLRLVIVTAAAGVALHALALRVPPTWWKSPLDRKLRPGRDRRPGDELDAIRKSFRGRRQPIAHGPPLPPETLRMLQPLIRAAADGANVGADEGPAGAERQLSAHALAVLEAEPLSHPSWRGTVAPDARATAAAVHRILDELDALAAAGRAHSSR